MSEALQKFLEACKQFAADPEDFGHDEMADCLHFFADEASNDDLEVFIKTLLDKGKV